MKPTLFEPAVAPPGHRLLGFDRINHWMTWLRSLGSRDVDSSFEHLLRLSALGIPDDLMEVIILQLERELIRSSDVDRAVTNLQRFAEASRSPLSLAALFQRDVSALPVLIQLFSTSQHASELLIRSPHYFDYLRLTGGQPRSREELIGDLCQEIAPLSDEGSVSRVLRRFKHRETLRIAYGDIIRAFALETTAQQISHVADAVCQAAYLAARKHCEEKRRVPVDPAGYPIGMVIMALGKLGGVELNYSSDIDLIFAYHGDSLPASDRAAAQYFFDDVARQMTRLLSETGESGMAYRVDLRLRPDGHSGPLTQSTDRLVSYYENRGRTWERQAWLKARVAAGDVALGTNLLKQLEPWLYQKYLSRFQIESIRTLKRRIEHRSHTRGDDDWDVKTGRGGIRDVEFVIQFLQLLHAANQPSIRTTNTLEAIQRLQRCDCLTMTEGTLLQRNYRLLRQVEHRLQLMFDLQTHRMPEDEWELRKLALRCGFTGNESGSALQRFQQEIRAARESNRQILNHVLHHAFPDPNPGSGGLTPEDSNDEADLILDPSPDTTTIHSVLQPYGFSNNEAVFRRLKELSHEKSRFLSDQRCRHFFAAICRSLLKEVSQSPNPAETLTELSRVADSLGNKGVLWELFSNNPPSRQLCVRLCSVAPYLTSILTGNPGMLDELMDSLLLDHLPGRVSLMRQLGELLRGAEDPIPILHSFKDAMHLLVGAREVLGKEPLIQRHRFLSSVAETCLHHALEHHYHRTVQRWGQPCRADGSPLTWSVLALGKLGGQEPNYHSDLDLMFVYGEDGMTMETASAQSTSHQHFFSRFATDAIKTLTHFGPRGRLYEIDCRLRPTGKGGALAVSRRQLAKYFGLPDPSDSIVSARAQLWERLALCKGRVLSPDDSLGEEITQLIRTAVISDVGRRETAGEIYQMRQRMQQGADRWNLKRGPGGTVDIEFSVQLLQLIYGDKHPEVLQQNTLAAIEHLKNSDLLSRDDAAFFSSSYEFLREIESRLRLLNLSARHDLPMDLAILEKLAFLLNLASADALQATVAYFLTENRRRFHRLVSQFSELPPSGSHW